MHLHSEGLCDTVAHLMSGAAGATAGGETLGGVPRLDLTHALQREHFFDWCHPTRAGAELVTQRVIEFLRAHGQ